MTERVEPSANVDVDNYKLSLAISHAFGTGWVVPGDEDVHASEDGASGTPLNAFDESHSSSSLEITIDTGEAFVGGKYAWIDETTDVALPTNSTETVYLALPSDAGNDVRIDYGGGNWMPPEPRSRIPLWGVTTDGDGVTSTTDLRVIGNPLTTDDEGTVLVEHLLDASASNGIVPAVVNGSLPSGTETGRIVYDQSREE